MARRDKLARIERFEEACRKAGLALTIQRRAIFEILLDREDHPTADVVYELARERIPSVSRTTVYRVLDTLVQVGAVTRVCHPGTAVRYDPKVHRHHHLICIRCDSIFDIEDERLDEIALPRLRRKGFTILDFNIQLRGLCGDCREKERGRG